MLLIVTNVALTPQAAFERAHPYLLDPRRMSAEDVGSLAVLVASGSLPRKVLASLAALATQGKAADKAALHSLKDRLLRLLGAMLQPEGVEPPERAAAMLPYAATLAQVDLARGTDVRAQLGRMRAAFAAALETEAAGATALIACLDPTAPGVSDSGRRGATLAVLHACRAAPSAARQLARLGVLPRLLDLGESACGPEALLAVAALARSLVLGRVSSSARDAPTPDWPLDAGVVDRLGGMVQTLASDEVAAAAACEALAGVLEAFALQSPNGARAPQPLGADGAAAARLGAIRRVLSSRQADRGLAPAEGSVPETGTADGAASVLASLLGGGGAASQAAVHAGLGNLLAEMLAEPWPAALQLSPRGVVAAVQGLASLVAPDCLGPRLLLTPGLVPYLVGLLQARHVKNVLVSSYLLRMCRDCLRGRDDLLGWPARSVCSPVAPLINSERRRGRCDWAAARTASTS